MTREPGGIRAGVRRLFRLGLRRSDIVRDQMDDELAFHFEARVEQLIARGMSPDDARAAALQRLGATLADTGAVLRASAEDKERKLEMRERLADLLSDLRYAARGLMRRPGFTTVAVLTLAVGIGANTAIFSAIDAILLRPLPFREPDRLVDIVQETPPNPNDPIPGDAPWSWRKFTIFRDAEQAFSDLTVYASANFSLTGTDPERVRGEWVSARYLATLGLRPARGGDFASDLHVSGGSPKVAIISDALWQRRFNADPAIVGRTIDIGSVAYEITGVLAPGFHGVSGQADVLVPIASRDDDDLAQPWSLEFGMIGRLKQGISLARANNDAKLAAARVWAETGMTRGTLTSGGTGAWSALARPLDATRVAPLLRRSLMVLFGAVLFVLLIACVNLANLLLGRAAARRQEIAIRLAIGAGRARLVRFLLTESLLLAFLGGVASVAVAWWGTHLLSRVNPEETLQAQGISGLGVAGFATIRLDGRALLFTFAATLVVGVLFGLVPALQATRRDLTQSLKDSGSGRTPSRRFRGATSRSTLVVTEVALALVLLAGSGLMIRSLGKRLGVDPGFDPHNLLTVRLTLPDGQFPRDSLPGYYDRMLESLQALPGVTHAALGDCPPLNGGCNITIITFPDRPPAEPGKNATIGVHFVTPQWFGAMHVPLKRGRLLTAADRAGTGKVVLINESAAKKYWPNEDPIGKPVKVFQGGFDTGATIVGIVGDVRFATIDSTARPDSYISYEQAPRPAMMIFLRTSVDPLSVAPAAQRVIRDLATGNPVYDMKTMAMRVAAATAQARFSAVLLGLFACVALALAIMGIYGVMSYGVLQRTREIGIRMALGADRGRVLGMVVREGAVLVAIGGLIGLVAALALTRVLRSLLFGVEPSDPLTYVVILAVLGGVALVASWIPARRAARVDPTQALRGG